MVVIGRPQLVPVTVAWLIILKTLFPVPIVVVSLPILVLFQCSTLLLPSSPNMGRMGGQL
jgi:hypothetical protein